MFDKPTRGLFFYSVFAIFYGLLLKSADFDIIQLKETLGERDSRGDNYEG